MSDKIVHTSGKRKTAIARATLKPGTGVVRVNGRSLEFIEPKMARMKISEPLLIAEDVAKKVDIDVRVMGGGIMSQCSAARLAIGKALVQHTGGALKEAFGSYDRELLVADVRYREERKPNRHGKARAKTQKSYR